MVIAAGRLNHSIRDFEIPRHAIAGSIHLAKVALGGGTIPLREPELPESLRVIALL
jgi:hypothetical protein